jgi:hypothetical protein
MCACAQLWPISLRHEGGGPWGKWVWAAECVVVGGRSCVAAGNVATAQGLSEAVSNPGEFKDLDYVKRIEVDDSEGLTVMLTNVLSGEGAEPGSTFLIQHKCVFTPLIHSTPLHSTPLQTNQSSSTSVC